MRLTHVCKRACIHTGPHTDIHSLVSPALNLTRPLLLSEETCRLGPHSRKMQFSLSFSRRNKRHDSAVLKMMSHTLDFFKRKNPSL